MDENSGQIIADLRKAHNEFFRLASAARVCAVNYSWLQLSRDRDGIIPLLDFDIVCSTLRRFVAAEMTRNQAQPHRLFGIGDTQGPKTVRFLLQTLRRFSLPYGSQAELLERKKL